MKRFFIGITLALLANNAYAASTEGPVVLCWESAVASPDALAISELRSRYIVARDDTVKSAIEATIISLGMCHEELAQLCIDFLAQLISDQHPAIMAIHTKWHPMTTDELFDWIEGRAEGHSAEKAAEESVGWFEWFASKIPGE